MVGVRFNDKHSYDDWGLVFVTKTIEAPKPQKKVVKVPGRNGVIDLTEVVTGNVRYEQRKISVTFRTFADYDEWPALLSEIANYLQGQRIRIVFDNDCAFYYLGRAEVDRIACDRKSGKLVITAECDPYKYNITTSAEDWLWDPFDFEQSVINETANLAVAGELDVMIICSQKWENPIIVSDSAMTVEFGGESHEVAAGSQVMYDIILAEGENTLKFRGNGTVTVNYVGGML